MSDQDRSSLDFTGSAWESLYEAVDDTYFCDADADLIYKALSSRLRIVPFGDYLKRYICERAEMTEKYEEISVKEYQGIIRDSFADNCTPPSFEPTTARLSALSKNWLTQKAVKRNVVFLLGFGLAMSVDDVNMFLTKALREREINPKNPFEVICWYCYKNGYRYPRFRKLWDFYNTMPINGKGKEVQFFEEEYTAGVRGEMRRIVDDATLMAHLSRLKSDGQASKISVSSRNHFNRLYDETRTVITGIYNKMEEDAQAVELSLYRDSMLRNARVSDTEFLQRMERKKLERRHYTADDISESDIEHILCSAIPVDHHGNLTPGKASKLNEAFAGKRFSRQHISEILAGNMDVDRFDLITLCFFLFSQKLDEFPSPKKRYIAFVESINAILTECSLGKLYIANPYECFVLMCILSEDPLGTYADVWELSYQ